MTQVQQAVSSPPPRQFSGGVEFHTYGSGSGTSLNPVQWVGWVPVFAGTLVWGGGMIWIVRKPLRTGDSHIMT